MSETSNAARKLNNAILDVIASHLGGSRIPRGCAAEVKARAALEKP